MALDHRKQLPQPETNSEITAGGCSSNSCPQPSLPCGCSRFPPPPPTNHHHPIPSMLILLVCMLLVGFLLASLCIVILNYLRRNSSRESNSSGFDDTHEDFLDENHGPIVDHPIWFINTVGLQQSVIDSITVCKYKAGDGLIEGTECSVCLSEFQEDESVRLLPKCSHAFHLPCIDTWLRSHKNCPLCRAPIVSDTAGDHVSAAEPNLDDSGSTNSDSSSDLEIFENHGGLGGGQAGGGGTSEVSVGNGDFGALSSEDGRVAETPKKALPCSSLSNCELRVLSDLADNNSVVEEELQPVRRSISMDSSSASMIYRAMANAHPLEHEEIADTHMVHAKKSKFEIAAKRRAGNSSFYQLVKSSSLRCSLQMGSVSMKRSSSGGKLSFFTQNRRQSSTLP